MSYDAMTLSASLNVNVPKQATEFLSKSFSRILSDDKNSYHLLLKLIRIANDEPNMHLTEAERFNIKKILNILLED